VAKKEDIVNKYKLGFRVGILAIIINIILFGLKYWAGAVSGSVALIADAWHTLGDSISSMILITGIYFARIPADKKHPFGHGRAELLTSIAIGFVLVLIGFNFLMESIQRLKDHEDVSFGTIAIVVTIISVLSKEAMARIAFWAGKTENAKSVIADGWHHRSDALTSVVILLGILLGKYFWWIDGVLGTIVSILIFYTAYKIVKEATDTLLGEVPEKELLKKIEDIAKEVYGKNLGLHHFHVHKYGHHTEMTFHIILPENMELKDAGKITQALFERIKNDLNIIATIHIDTNSNYHNIEKEN
jgi:cation diffusion facilitator family transporter